MCVFHLSCSVHLDARPIHLMHVFPFRAINCMLRGDGFSSCAYFIYHCSVHLDARPIHLMCVFSFRATSCTLQGDLSISCAYFHFVQQVARYKATYPSHERTSISCNKLHATRRPIPLMSVLPFRATRYMKCGEWRFDIVYLW